jgi:cysteine desulfurase
MTSNRAYLDHNATSPVRPEARDAMVAALDCLGNPSSIHFEGRAARALIETARETTAHIFGVKPSAVTFTSGGTEAANWLFRPLDSGKISISTVEHACVLQGHRFHPGHVRMIPVSEDGTVEFPALEEVIQGASVVAVQAANNETGVIQPLEKIAELTRANGAMLICDAVQAIGRLPMHDLDKADLLFFSAHKFGGPKGVGAVISRGAGTVPQPLMRGGGQERRQRSGTENVVAIAGLGAALEAATGQQDSFTARAKAWQTRLESGIRRIAPDAVIFGDGAGRLANTTCFAIPGKLAEMLLIAFDLEGIALSSGSACSSGKVERSHVLDAMGVPQVLSVGALRVSTGWNTQDSVVERFLSVLSKLCSDRQERRAA